MSAEELKEVNTGEIVTFLNNASYGILDEQIRKASHANNSMSMWFFNSPSMEEKLIAGLEHYLSTQLGVHWRKARAKRNHWENFLWAISLDREIEKQIGSAVTYLEKLEKGE